MRKDQIWPPLFICTFTWAFTVALLYAHMAGELKTFTHFVKTSNGTVQADTVNQLNTITKKRVSTAGLTHGYLPDSTVAVLGASKDTTRIYDLRAGSIQFDHKAVDAAGADSAEIEYKIYLGSKNYLHKDLTFTVFVLVDSVTFTGTGRQEWVFTSAGSNRPANGFWYMTREGTANNRKLTPVSVTTEVTYAWIE